MYPNWVISLVIGSFLLGAVVGGLIVHNNMKKLKQWEAYPEIAKDAAIAYLNDIKDMPEEKAAEARQAVRGALDRMKLYIQNKL